MTYFMYFHVVDNISVLFHFLLRDSTEMPLHNLGIKHVYLHWTAGLISLSLTLAYKQTTSVYQK